MVDYYRVKQLEARMRMPIILHPISIINIYCCHLIWSHSLALESPKVLGGNLPKNGIFKHDVNLLIHVQRIHDIRINCKSVWQVLMRGERYSTTLLLVLFSNFSRYLTTIYRITHVLHSYRDGEMNISRDMDCSLWRMLRWWPQVWYRLSRWDWSRWVDLLTMNYDLQTQKFIRNRISLSILNIDI